MVQAPDALEILLPASREPELKRVRNVVQFLRLLTDDARSDRAGAVTVGLEQARCELEVQVRRRVEGALTDLLRHHLSAMATPDTFLDWGRPGLDHANAWRTVDEFRDDLPWLANLPEPAEPAASVAWRLIDSRERLGECTLDLLPWKARILRFTEGTRAAEELLRGSPEIAAVGPSVDSTLVRACLAVLTECLLDRGAVREARTLLHDRRALIDGDPRLRQLLSWTLLCTGDYAGAKGAVVGLSHGSGVLPTPLVELRTHRPEWLPCLAGRSVREGLRPAVVPSPPVPLRERSEFGAAVLGVFCMRPGGEAHPLLLDAAPGLRHAIASWLQERDGACAVAGQCEHELVVSARAVVVHREGDRAIEGTLGRARTLALALVPVLDGEGEVSGWVHLECEHHLLPSLSVISERASTWREAILARDGPGLEPARSLPPGSSGTWSLTGEPLRSACTGVFDGLVAELGIKTAQRRWWGFAVEGRELRLLASGGEGAGLSSENLGRGRALTRAVATSSRVSFENPDPRLSIDPNAGSGVVFPLSAGGVLCGLFAIESSRKRDFRDADLDRFSRAAERGGLALRLAQFVAWHSERFGDEVWLDVERPEFRGFARDFLTAARSRSPVVLCGPAGAGKTVHARWLHFESRSEDAPIVVIDCGASGGGGSVQEWLSSSRGGSLILKDVERLPSASQAELLRVLVEEEGASTGNLDSSRVLVTTRVGLGPATEDGRLRDDLSHRLDRLQFRLPALRDRREDILPLVACLARRFARQEHLRVPTFDDEALALLWRQSWEGNVRELESFVYKLVLFGRRGQGRAPEIIEPAQILEIARRFSLHIVRRLPSRHPMRGDLLAALRVTRKPGGRLNKTRAALYLGWDPDTLVARIAEAGIGEEIENEHLGTIPGPTEEEDPDPVSS